MMPRLFVGPDVSIPNRLDDATAAWHRFAHVIPAGPPPGKIVCPGVSNHPDVGIAITKPLPGKNDQLNGDYWIVVGRRFFESGLTEERQGADTPP